MNKNLSHIAENFQTIQNSKSNVRHLGYHFSQLLKKPWTYAENLLKKGIKLRPGAGKYKITDQSGHCNVWFYDSFNIPNDIELLNLRKIES